MTTIGSAFPRKPATEQCNKQEGTIGVYSYSGWISYLIIRIFYVYKKNLLRIFVSLGRYMIYTRFPFCQSAGIIFNFQFIEPLKATGIWKLFIVKMERVERLLFRNEPQNIRRITHPYVEYSFIYGYIHLWLNYKTKNVGLVPLRKISVHKKQ